MKHVTIALIAAIALMFCAWCYTNQDNHMSIDQHVAAENVPGMDGPPAEQPQSGGCTGNSI